MLLSTLARHKQHFLVYKTLGSLPRPGMTGDDRGFPVRIHKKFITPAKLFLTPEKIQNIVYTPVES